MWELAVFPGKTESDFDILSQVVDSTLSYEFDELTVLREKASGDIYVVQTSGCSCPSPEEMAQITLGPVKTVQQVLDWFESGDYSGKTYPRPYQEEVVRDLRGLVA